MGTFLILTNPPNLHYHVKTSHVSSDRGNTTMSDLLRHQKTLQALSEVIQLSLGVEVFFVDDMKVAVAGTGPYRANIGSKRPTDSYVDVTITDAASQLVTEPRYTKQCYRCEYRTLCPYSMVMCRPIIKDNRIKGLIGFLGFSDDQRRAMIERSSSLSELSQRLDFVWETEDLDLHRILSHPKTREFINAIDEGIILTSPDYRILNMNERSEQLLPLGKIVRDAGGSPPVRQSAKSGSPGAGRLDRDWAGGLKDLRSEDFPVSDGRDLVGRLIVLGHMERSRRTWKGCPLSAPRPSVIVGTSEAIVRLKDQASSVAESDSTVLILGETGVGKEVTARHIHEASRRWAGPFETVNSAAIPDTLFESELFGYAPGAFTGARKKGKSGKFQLAHRGTIFLDEVGRLSLDNQARLLRILDEGELQRLGDERKERVDVRVLAATNINLEQAVKENRFLKDLYYRLAVVPLVVPPLRQRVEDIPLLIEHFTEQLKKILPRRNFRGFSPETLEFLMGYDWPGNVRELRNTVEFAMNMVRDRLVTIRDLPSTFRPQFAGAASTGSTRSDLTTFAQMEYEHIQTALQTFGETTEGKRRAARHLGISLSTLYRRLSRRKRAPRISYGVDT
ncbi:MAG: sigma 54-interacting transcriptional regulator [Desulfomonilaceae bacterium]|nr:sigma 54-interacting transcriptional regulator [Desulfomonilaceae bacterium]